MQMWVLDSDFYCKCGCKMEVNLGSMYIRGHSGRGWKLTKEQRKKWSLVKIGTKHSEETKAKISRSNKGKKKSKETRERISFSKKGKTLSENHRKNLSLSLKGRKFSEEHKKNKSLAQIGRKYSEETKTKLSFASSGNKSHFWQGGTYKDPYGPGNYRSLREQIRVRDNHICQECGKVWNGIERKFAPHHIDYNKSNHEVWNRITLCTSCHGKTGFNREYWKEKYSLIIKAKYNRLLL